MNKAIRTALVIAASGLLLSAVTMAQAGTADKKDTTKGDQQHHSRLAKAAFWKHKKSGADTGKKSQPTHATPQATSAKSTTAKTAAVKPVSAKTQKQAAKTSNAKASAVKKSGSAKSSANTKSSGASKAKPKQKKAQLQTVSVKQ